MLTNTFWIGWRILSRRSTLRQAALVAVGVAVASTLLFAMASIPGAIRDRQTRDSNREWLSSGQPTDAAVKGVVAAGSDRLGEQQMTHVLIAAGSIEIAGLDAKTEAGAVLVSAALQDELESDPTLARRLHGDVKGTLPEEFLVEPTELVSVSFVDPEEVVATGVARALPDEPVSERTIEISSAVAFVVAVALLVLTLPVVFLVSAATRLGLESRRQRIRTLSLVGAERRQIRIFLLLETVSAALVGLIAGYVIFWLARPLIASLRVGGRNMFQSALQPTMQLALVVVGFVIAASIVASLVGSRRLEAAPLEANRSGGKSIPGVVVLGLGIVAIAIGVTSPTGTDAPHPLALVGMVLVAIGLAVTARMTTGAVGRWLGARTGDGPSLLAARRMDRSPGEVNRPLTAVIVSVFVISAFFTITGTLLRSSSPWYQGLDRAQVVIEAANGTLSEIAERVSEQEGVDAVVVEGFVAVEGPWSSPRLGVVADCKGLVDMVGLEAEGCGSGVVVSESEGVAAGSTLVVGSSPLGSDSEVTTNVIADGSTFRGDFHGAVIIDPTVLDGAFSSAISRGQALVRFDPEVMELEQLRTVVVEAAPTAQVRTVAEVEFDRSAPAREVRVLAGVGLIVVFSVAVFSLTVGTASHLLQQRNALAFLRAGGLLPAQIRKLVALEATVPLALSAILASLLGVGVGTAVVVSAGGDPSVPWGVVALTYLASVGLGVVVWAGFVPMLNRLTSPTGLRFE